MYAPRGASGLKPYRGPPMTLESVAAARLPGGPPVNSYRSVAEFFGPVSWSSGRSLGCCGRSPLTPRRCPRDGITRRRAGGDTRGDVTWTYLFSPWVSRRVPYADKLLRDRHAQARFDACEPAAQVLVVLQYRHAFRPHREHRELRREQQIGEAERVPCQPGMTIANFGVSDRRFRFKPAGGARRRRLPHLP
jgi:hypothetical protein